MIERNRLGEDVELLLPGIVPKLSNTPGKTKWIGPKLGEHTAEVLAGIGINAEQQSALKQRGVI
jgi:formyl-CoA transferase